MEGLTLTSAAVALALVVIVIVAQIIAAAFGAVDPGAAF